MTEAIKRNEVLEERLKQYKKAIEDNLTNFESYREQFEESQKALLKVAAEKEFHNAELQRLTQLLETAESTSNRLKNELNRAIDKHEEAKEI